MDEELKNYTNLGTINSWKYEPKEYTLCNILGHKKREVIENEQRTLRTVICDDCKIYYKVDSSD